MTTTPPNASSSSPTEGNDGGGSPPAPPAESTEVPNAPGVEPAAGPGVARGLLKGCGCLLGLVILGVGVALLGKGEPASWGSALFGVVILVVIVGTSGLIGWWNR